MIKPFALLLLFAAALCVPLSVQAEEKSALIGESGYACLQRLVDAAPAARNSEVYLEASIGFQDCFREAALFVTCPDGNFAACANQSRGQLVSERYAAAVRAEALAPEPATAFKVVAGLGKPERYAKCLSNFRVDAEPASDSDDDIRRALVLAEFGRATCDAIVGLAVISVLEGLLMLERSGQ
ncbi:MAG: hypothetical protein AAGF74_08110 [Pseudomonadota bacterium]